MEILRFPGTYSGLSVRHPVDSFPALVACGELLCVPGLQFGQHSHPATFEFLYLMRGSCRFTVPDFGPTTAVRPGEMFIVHPDEQHTLDLGKESKSQIIWMRLDLSQLPGIGGKLQAKLLPRRTRLLHSAYDVEPLMRGAIRHAMARLPRFEKILRAQVLLMAELLLQRIEVEDKPHGRRAIAKPVAEIFEGPRRAQPVSAQIARAMESIRQQVGGKLKIDKVAVAADYSVSHLYARFREETGMTPHEYHLDTRMELAREALLRPEATVIMVAELLGFSSPQHFSAVFSHFLGITPRAWRAQHRNGS